MDLLVKEEIAKINAVNCISDFEEEVMEEIENWASINSLSFSSRNELISAYWASKLD